MKKFDKSTVTDHIDEYNHRFLHGVKKGYTIQIPGFDENINFKRGNVLYLYGPPGCGKTFFYLWLAMRLAKLYNLKFYIYTPESDSNASVVAQLTEFYWGARFECNDFGITQEQKKEAFRFIANHFYIVTEIRTLPDLFEDFKKQPCDFYSIDTWSAVIHKEIGSNIQHYLDEKLPEFYQLMKFLDAHGTIMNHPIKPESVQVEASDGKPITSYFPVTPYTISGGQAWFRHGRNMVGIWRPAEVVRDGKKAIQMRPDGLTAYEEGDTFLWTHKIKPSECGQRNVKMNLRYDWKRRDYEYI